MCRGCGHLVYPTVLIWLVLLSRYDLVQVDWFTLVLAFLIRFEGVDIFVVVFVIGLLVLMMQQ